MPKIRGGLRSRTVRMIAACGNGGVSIRGRTRGSSSQSIKHSQDKLEDSLLNNSTTLLGENVSKHVTLDIIVNENLNITDNQYSEKMTKEDNVHKEIKTTTICRNEEIGLDDSNLNIYVENEQQKTLEFIETEKEILEVDLLNNGDFNLSAGISVSLDDNTTSIPRDETMVLLDGEGLNSDLIEKEHSELPEFTATGKEIAEEDLLSSASILGDLNISGATLLSESVKEDILNIIVGEDNQQHDKITNYDTLDDNTVIPRDAEMELHNEHVNSNLIEKEHSESLKFAVSESYEESRGNNLIRKHLVSEHTELLKIMEDSDIGSKVMQAENVNDLEGEIEQDDQNDKDFIPNVNDAETSEDEAAEHELYDEKHKSKTFSRKEVQKRKVNRNSGRKYITARGKVREARKLKPLRDNCRNQCKDILDENTRQKLFDEYWSLTTHDRRVAFVASLITTKETNITRTKINNGRRLKNRQMTYTYHFEIDGKKAVVCKSCFLATLDETEKCISCTVANKLKSCSGVTHTDKRGAHTPIHKTAQYKINEVITHINSFPAYESHYSRRHTNKKYLASNLNLNKMYELYRELYSDKPVSIKIYAKEFHNLGLKFKKPKNDTCSKCDSLIAKEKFSENEEDKMNARKEREEHLTCADRAYAEKEKDKNKGNDDNSHATYSFDLQQVLQTPYLSTNKMLYLRQLATYNLTIHNGNTGESSHYMWSECIAGRGANEIASCLYNHIFNIPEGIKRAVFYSDTCGGQNKNFIVLSMFQFVLQHHPTLETVDHKFLVPGHTHMECDVDHAVIERAKKKCSFDIHVPRDWFQLVRTASKKNKFYVIAMEQDKFFNFSDLSNKGPMQNKSKSFKLKNVCWLRYTKNAVVQYKCSFEEDEQFKTAVFLKKGQTTDSLKEYTLIPLYKALRPISSKKKKTCWKL